MALCLAEYGATCWLRWDAKCTKVATTADHVIPRSRGGPDEIENLRPACLHCNSARGDRPWPGSLPIMPVDDILFFMDEASGHPAQPLPFFFGTETNSNPENQPENDPLPPDVLAWLNLKGSDSD